MTRPELLAYLKIANFAIELDKISSDKQRKKIPKKINYFYSTITQLTKR